MTEHANPFSAEARQAALPDMRQPHVQAGLEAPVRVYRDAWGIPHAQAQSEHDAFFAQGYCCAQDRLWQMELNRLQAQGRCAEVLGSTALPGDLLLRRLNIPAHAKAQWEGLAPETRAMLQAYADGVNAWVQERLWPVEFRALEREPTLWRAEDSLEVYTARHVLMGVWESKLLRKELLEPFGAEALSALSVGYAPTQPILVPPHERYAGPLEEGLQVFRHEIATLTRGRHGNADGSNNWVLGPSRTRSRAPLLAGDPHRGLEVPNVYYQNHIAGPDFDLIGFSFPGVPGFPHFAHNGQVAWAITHGYGDHQDLYREQFHPQRPQHYRWLDEWLEAQHEWVQVEVYNASSVRLERWRTRHGPIVAGDPRQGVAFAFRDTAFQADNHTFDAIRALCFARDADTLEEALRSWVEPVNNLVYCDRQGAFGYRSRGRIPLRGEANRWLPVPGWDGAHEWNGVLAFEELPHVRNPACGYAYSANNRVHGAAFPHSVGLDFSPGFRALRIQTHLGAAQEAGIEEMRALLRDTHSVPARTFIDALNARELLHEESHPAWGILRAWDGNVLRESAAPSIYAMLRLKLLDRLLEAHLGAERTQTLLGVPERAAGGWLLRIQARLGDWIASDNTRALPKGTKWADLVRVAMEDTLSALTERLGATPAAWRWERVHRTDARHALSERFPQARAVLDPPTYPMSGDGDTVQAAGYLLNGDFSARFLSVARYIMDPADWDASLWSIPGGSSGHPGSPHYQDQLPLHMRGELVPMRYSWHAIAQAAESEQLLSPAP